ncbi:GNAT family N-acetyltransferase [Corynebacterium uterequi]|uniref:Acetyltransferase, ribosomal protein N-acetylase n=1 Tax=Corynebacterium uterequi TaxID=1072256 RepID=A0A0G3HJF9_9CORY|nr:GNAT family N-acetyltransferase [Corynebacterium uterequi]AKK12088.1 acetyltransferase, ribosomal protein N-acetylase [Corynebacterium uterequi]
MITTPRLTLRRWEASDAPALYRLASDPLVTRWLTWPTHTSVEDSAYALEHALTGPEAYAVVWQDQLIGSIELKLGNPIPELGYWLGREFWGRGFATEAGHALCERAFTELGYPELLGRYFEGNDASKNVLTKLGFVATGVSAPYELPDRGEVRTIHEMLLRP